MAVLSWELDFHPPGPYVDPSARTGLALAVRDGLQFGTEVVYSYGPLGFLRDPWVWFGDLAAVAYAYSSAVHIALACGLVFLLRRLLPTAAAVAIAVVVLTLPHGIDAPLAIAAIAALGLPPRPSSRALSLFISGMAVFAAVETLSKISIGPAIFVVGLLALAGRRARPLQIAAFVGGYVLSVVVLWLAAGQDLMAFDDFIRNSAEIVSGYSEGMALRAVPAWQEAAAVAGFLALAIAVVARAQGDRRARLTQVAIVVFLAFCLFKEGMTRADPAHLTIFFSTAIVLWLALGWERHQVTAALAGVGALGVMAVHVFPPPGPTGLDLVENVERATTGALDLLSTSRRDSITSEGRAEILESYPMEPRLLERIGARPVAVDPWEVSVIWAHELNWEPLPVFQPYAAYTPELDRLNAEALAEPSGPELVLRENTELLDPQFPAGAIDGRYRGWESPLAARALLCHFEPVMTTPGWQLMERTRDRCGTPRPLRSVDAEYGEEVVVPPPGRGEVVYAEIEGTGAGGLELVRRLLLRAAVHEVVLDKDRVYRLVRATAAGGLLLRGPGALGSGPFAQVPQAETIELTGGEGALRFDFYALPLRPAPARGAPRPPGTRSPPG